MGKDLTLIVDSIAVRDLFSPVLNVYFKEPEENDQFCRPCFNDCS